MINIQVAILTAARIWTRVVPFNSRPRHDVIWAPLSSYMMTQLYGGKKGLIAAVFVFIEEALPLSDVIPSFSIMWFYSYYLDKETSEKE